MVPVTYSQLVFGTKIKVPVMGKIEELDIPPLTRAGQKFRLWGLGFPDIRNSSVKGDFVVVAKLDIPDKIDEKYKEILNNLAEMEKDTKSQTMTSFNEFLASAQST